MRKKLIIGLIAGISLLGITFFYSGISEKGNLNKKPYEDSETVAIDGQEAEVFRKTMKGKINFDDITYKDGRVLLKVHVLDLKGDGLEPDMKVKDGIVYKGEDIKIGTLINTEKGSYVKVDIDRFFPTTGDKVAFATLDYKTNEKLEYKIKGLELEILGNGSLKVVSESKAEFVGRNFYSDNYNEFFRIKAFKDNKELEKTFTKELILEVEKTINKDKKVDDRDKYIFLAAKKIYGTDEYFLVDFNYGQRIVNIKTKEIYEEQPLEIFVESIFFDKGQPMSIDRYGNLMELSLKDNKISVAKTHELGLKPEDKKKHISAGMWYKDENYVYGTYSETKSINNEVRETKNVIYNFDLKTKKPNIISETDTLNKKFIIDYGFFEEYILFKKDLEKSDEISLGKFNGNKIDTIIKNIEGEDGTLVTYFGEEYIITTKPILEDTEVVVYKKNK